MARNVFWHHHFASIIRIIKHSSSQQQGRTFSLGNSLLYRKDVALVGVPFSGGQPKKGVEMGPAALRKAGIKEKIEGLGRVVHDYGDIDCQSLDGRMGEIVDYKGTQIKRPTKCGNVSKKVAEYVERGARENNIVVTMGGDHSLATGSIYGHQQARGDICVLWIDAHNDINTYKTTGSGNLHGMALSFLINGLPDHSTMPGYEWTKQCLSPFDIAYIGLRDTDPGEQQITHDLGILTFSMYEVDRYVCLFN